MHVFELVSTCCPPVQAFYAKSQLSKGRVVKNWPLDKEYFSIFKSKHKLATLSTLLEPTRDTEKFFSQEPFVFVLLCSWDFLSWLTSLCIRVLESAHIKLA